MSPCCCWVRSVAEWCCCSAGRGAAARPQPTLHSYSVTLPVYQKYISRFNLIYQFLITRLPHGRSRSLRLLTHCTALRSATSVTEWSLEGISRASLANVPRRPRKLRQREHPLHVDGPLTTDAEHASVWPPRPIRIHCASGSPVSTDAKLQ